MVFPLMQVILVEKVDSAVFPVRRLTAAQPDGVQSFSIQHSTFSIRSAGHRVRVFILRGAQKRFEAHYDESKLLWCVNTANDPALV